MSNDTLAPEALKHLHVFRRCLPMQVRLHEIVRSLGSTDGQVCLDIGTENGMLSYHLRKNGGKWHTVVVSEDAASTVREVVVDNVHVVDGGNLPFKKKSFDVVVISDSLERFIDDDAFIEECHRILKPDGRLVVNVARLKSWTMISLVRRMAGVTPEKRGLARAGYTETDLFKVLKNGFDVHNMRSYTRFFVEFTDLVVAGLLGRAMSAGRDSRWLMQFYSVAGVFYRLAFQLDMLLLFNKGHRLIALAKRRSWRSRDAPVLVDGRSISEAVLSRVIR